MDRRSRIRVFAILTAVVVIGLGLAIFMAIARSPQVVAQTVQAATVLAPENVDAKIPSIATEITATLTVTNFDNTVFIFAPSTRPELFVDCIDNPYYPFIPGTVYSYEAETEEGLETITVTVTDQTKEVLGIQATVVRDVVLLDGVLLEDTLDWYAQDVRGNVWYLGEEVKNYEDGQFVDNAGSWEAGVDGALPGIIMLSQPLPGDIYRQEYFAGEAKDMAGVLRINETVAVPYDDFTKVLVTADYNPLDGELENKCYAPGVGLIREEVVDADGTATGEVLELVGVSRNRPASSANACGEDNNDDDHDDQDQSEDKDTALFATEVNQSTTLQFLPIMRLP